MKKNYIPEVEEIQQFGKINMALLGIDGEYAEYILKVRQKVVEAGCPYDDKGLNAFTYGLIIGMSME